MSSSCAKNSLNYDRFSQYPDNKLISLGQGISLLQGDYKPIHKFFEDYAHSHPNDISVVSQEKHITYKELNTWAHKISEDLIAAGVKQGQRIAIIIEPSMAMVAAVLAVLQAGASYVPLDHKQPLNRIKVLLNDSDISGILSNKSSFEHLNDLDYPIYHVNCFFEQNFQTPALEYTSNKAFSDKDIAYIIYTSGSTGEPKGVMVGHKQLLNSTISRHMVYPGKQTFLLVSPLSSDSSMAGLWLTLFTGGKLVVATHEESRDPETLIKLIKKNNITQILCIPSLYQNVLDVVERDKFSHHYLQSLSTVILAGEKLHQSLVERHFTLLGGSVALVNEYGPTETTIWATYRRFNFLESVSIGRPIPGTHVYVLDDNLNLVPQGEIGELYIGGGQVTQGYFNRPEATRCSFLVDIYNNEKEAFMYKTGDLVRWDSEGNLEFIGRKDHQIKIRGHRVELGAIETYLCSLPYVRDAVIIPKGEDISLLAFIVTSSKVSSEDLREKMSAELPSFMVPSKIIFLETFPLTSNGKVDRSTLADMAEEFLTSQVPSLQEKSSFTENITQVASAWSELLGLNPIPHDSNFFDLGGHSLMIFKLQEALERHTGIRPPIVSLFRYTTVAEQAQFISNESSKICGNSHPYEKETAA